MSSNRIFSRRRAFEVESAISRVIHLRGARPSGDLGHVRPRVEEQQSDVRDLLGSQDAQTVQRQAFFDRFDWHVRSARPAPLQTTGRLLGSQ